MQRNAPGCESNGSGCPGSHNYQIRQVAPLPRHAGGVRGLCLDGRHPEVEFLRLGSYRLGAETSGRVSLPGEPPRGMRERTVLLVDDVLDTGLTLRKAQALVRD